MNNYYALIYLTEHLIAKLRGSIFRKSLSPHKNVWEGYFEPEKADPLRLVFSTTPGEVALFTDHDRPPKKSNVVTFFDTLSGLRVSEIQLAEQDRFLRFDLSDGSALLFKLFGHPANLFHIKAGVIESSFRNPQSTSGQPAPEPRKPTSSPLPEENPGTKKLIQNIDPAFPRHLTNAVIDHYDLQAASPHEVKHTLDALTEAMREKPQFRLLQSGGLCLIPVNQLPLPDQERFDDINRAIRTTYREASHLRRFSKRKDQIQTGLKKELDRVSRTLRQLEGADKALSRAGEYEKLGHILMAHAHESIPAGSDKIELTDIFNPDETVTLEVKQNLSMAGHAEFYYERAAKAKRRIKENRRREKQLRATYEELNDLNESFSSVERLSDLKNWEKTNQARLEDAGILKKNGTGRSSTPWRSTTVDGYDIWIGRNAKSNDQLTTTAHKEDIWLHARGSGGSHVVIRMGNRTDEPPQHVLHKAAAYAAWHSRQRGSDLVPVIVTRKKYVTKPKGAPAGTVRVNREEVLMISPKKPDNQDD